MKIISITGIPGTGKSTLAKLLEKKLEYKTNSKGLRYFNEILKAVATVDHKKTDMRAYLIAV